MTIRQVTIFIFLFLAGLGLFVNFNQHFEIPFTSLSSDFKLQSSRNDSRVLLQGDIFSGDFQTNFKNLGQVAIRFFNFNRDSDDILEFRLKESNSNEWFYVARHKTDQFLPDAFFPFGFPIMQNSENKSFHVEIESLRGSTESGIAISKEEPQAVAIYDFTKTEIFASRINFLNFIVNKGRDIIVHPKLLSSLLLYSLPAIFYLVLVFSGSLYILPLGFIGIILSIQISTADNIHVFQYILIPFLWLGLSRLHELSYRITVIISGILLLFGITCLLKSNSSLAENYLTWGYLFLFTGFFQLILSQKKSPLGRISPRQFFDSLYVQSEMLLFKSRQVFIFLTEKTEGFGGNLFKLTVLAIITLGTGFFAFNSFSKLANLQHIYSEYYGTNGFYYFLRFNSLKLIILYIFSVFVGIKSFKFYRYHLPAILIIVLVISFFQPRLVGMDKSTLVVPRITTISPNTIHESWTDVVVNGHNFKDLPFEGKVVLGGVDQYLIISWTDKKIIFRTNPDTTKTGKLIVITKDGKKSNQVELKYSFEY